MASQRTMSSQNGDLTSQKFHLPDMLTSPHFPIPSSGLLTGCGTEADKGQSQNIFKIRKNIKLQCFLEIIVEEFIKSEKLLYKS